MAKLGFLGLGINESFVLSTTSGVSPHLILEIINNSAARSALVALQAPLVFQREFAPNFSVKWLEKDIALMLQSAAEMTVPAPLTAVSRQMYRAAMAKGFGDEDICGSIRVLEEFAGCEVTSQPPPG
jgi:3-hydroxyisobutyrate dehydrogenase-like beta-hydroxyacid dehydrogenase